MFGFLRRLFAGTTALQLDDAVGMDVQELTRRLGVSELQLRETPVEYATFTIRKRGGGTRVIAAPSPALKSLQRIILRRLLAKLTAHPSATGFERRHSIVTNAIPHVGREVVIRLDLKDFFGSILAKRVHAYFREVGWNREAADLLTRLCTHKDLLPQGAPTSPRLSNLVNHRLDARLATFAGERGVAYSRYADDITLSGPASSDVEVTKQNPKTLARVKGSYRINDVIHAVKLIVREEGYELHTDKKLRIARRHDRQTVTGLVVNDRVNLPRYTRRWLRAVRHHQATGRPTTLDPQQLTGWDALQKMIEAQSRE